jgi:protein SCO1
MRRRRLPRRDTEREDDPVMLRALLCAALAALALPCHAQEPDLRPMIGARIEPGVTLTDEAGERHAFRDLLSPGGTLLVLGYHRCENLCGVLQRQLAETVAELPPGRAPAVLFASLDPEETPGDARAMRARLGAAAPGADLSRWQFLTGAPGVLAALSAPLGMETYVRPGGQVIVHPAATAVLTPDGTLSEVFYGFDFSVAELDGALGRAADGHVGGLRERVLLLCSGIDEAVGRIARGAWTAIRLAAGVTLVLVAAALVLLWRREAR